jgi:hypothetical protein
MAEGEGFEPPLPFRVKRFSRPPVSTAHTSLRESSNASHDTTLAPHPSCNLPPSSPGRSRVRTTDSWSRPQTKDGVGHIWLFFARCGIPLLPCSRVWDQPRCGIPRLPFNRIWDQPRAPAGRLARTPFTIRMSPEQGSSYPLPVGPRVHPNVFREKGLASF